MRIRFLNALLAVTVLLPMTGCCGWRECHWRRRCCETPCCRPACCESSCGYSPLGGSGTISATESTPGRLVPTRVDR
jgi:hypothetical protein